MAWSALLALGISLLLQPAVIAVLRRRAVLDVPNERSSHRIPTPRGGGVAVVAGMAVAAWAAPQERAALVVLGGVLVCALVGFLEDVRGVSARTRLAAQCVVAAVVIASLWRLAPRPDLLGVLVCLACVFGYVAVVNAVNFMDGINGISTAQAVVGGVAYALIGYTVGERSLLVVGLVTAAAMAAFAPFNVPRAQVFLGDTGSYGVGAALAGLAVLALSSGVPPEAALGPLVPYLADTGTTIARRMAAGEPWYQPHRSHVYQRLTVAGYSHVQVSVGVGLLVALTSSLGAVSLVGHSGGRVLADLAMVALLAAYLASPELLSRRRVGTV